MAEINELDHQRIEAAPAWWDIGTVRYFMVSSASGNDANVGYSDGAPDVSKAVATIAKLRDILPHEGNGRTAVVLIESANYAEALNLDGYSGYSPQLIVRATATIATAGCTRFDNSVADKIAVGGAIAAGTNAAGYNMAVTSVVITNATAASPIVCESVGHPLVTGDKIQIKESDVPLANQIDLVGWHTVTWVDVDHFSLDGTVGRGTFAGPVTATLQKVTLAGGGAPGFTDDFVGVSLCGYRIRFNATTTTVALRNQCYFINAVGQDTLYVSAALAASPVGTDVFYIETPGLTVSSVSMRQADVTLVGVYSTNWATSGFMGATVALTFCATTSASLYFRYGFSITASGSWTDEGSTSRNSGTGFTGWGGTTTYVRYVADQMLLTDSAIYASSFLVVQNGATTRLGQYFPTSMGTFYLRGELSTNGSQASYVSLVQARIQGNIRASGYIAVYLAVITNATNSTGALSMAAVDTHVSLEGVHGTRGNTLGFRMGQTGTTGGNQAVANGSAYTKFSYYNNTLGGTRAEVMGSGNFGYEFKWLWQEIKIRPLIDAFNNYLMIQDIAAGYAATLVVPQRPDAFNVSIANVNQYYVVRSNGTAREVTHAQANTAANAAGVVGIAVSTTDTANNVFGAAVNRTGQAYVQFDTSGGKPAPAVGNIAYLSVDTAGMAQASAPVLAATNQKLRLGYVIGIHASDATIGIVDLQVELIPALAEGLP